MRFPELLYQLSARDQQVTWLDPRFDQQSTSLLAISVPTPVFQVPVDRVFVLCAAAVRADPGAGQNVDSLVIQILAPAGSAGFNLKQRTEVAAANINVDLDWTGEILLPPAWQIRGIGSFNAGAVANLVVHNFFGILIPVGNIQRV